MRLGMAFAVLLLGSSAAHASVGTVSTTIVDCHSAILSITLDGGWQTASSSRVSTYEVQRKDNSGAGYMVEKQTSTAPIELDNLDPMTLYKLIVKVRVRRSNGFTIPSYHYTDDFDVTTPACGLPYVPQPGDVRLRHERTGKCIYDRPVDGGTAANFTCWRDGWMAMVIDHLSGNDVRLRFRTSNECLYRYSADRTVHYWTCWNDPNQVWVLDPLSNNRFHLRHKQSGECAYGSSDDGGALHTWGCWNDPNMVYVLDPF